MARRLAGLASAPLAVLLAVAGTAAVLVLWGTEPGGSFDATWAPSLDLRLSFTLDGIGALYGLLACGIGIAVFAYAWKYMPPRLARQERPRFEEVRFYALLVLFMVSMVGLATAQDLILLFVFWDLTAISSYFLIGYDRHEADSRIAAIMALLVTGITAVLLLVGALLLHHHYGTFSIPELAELVEPGATVTVAGALIALAGLAKSAQAPFQFWLPRAMVAPTPVSAYLHSAAMVAAGVLLIGRAYPILDESRLVLDALLVLGGASILVGGVLAFARDNLKQLLAYSTISQYGYVVVMYGLGGPLAASAAAFYVISHAIAKSALFMTAGAVTEATGGKKALSEVGGLARSLPGLAVASGIAVATLIALPLTVGFFADELFFYAAIERGTLAAILSVAAAGLTFAYLGRFWAGIFLGPLRAQAERLAPMLWAPIAALAAIAFAFGLAPGPIAELAADAGEASTLVPATVDVAYHLDLRTANVMALAAWGTGLLLLAGRRLLEPALRAFTNLGGQFGSERLYGETVALLNRTSDRMHDFEVRDLRTRLAAVLIPAGILVMLGVAATPAEGAYVFGEIPRREIGLVLVLALASLAAIGTTFPRHHLTLVLALAGVGFSLAAVYAFFGAPDVALVAVLIETIFAVLFIGVFALLPRSVLRREARLPTGPRRHRRDLAVGLISGGVAFVVAWGTLSRPTPDESVAHTYIEEAPDAHANDIVTAILADFRSLDTLGEITVVAIAFAGVAVLLRRGRVW
jgi:multicomponent Na+:H+ antiporter subunit A